VTNIPICGWSNEPIKSLTPCDLENGGIIFSKTSANCMVSQPERWQSSFTPFYFPFYFLFVNLEFVYSLSIALA